MTNTYCVIECGQQTVAALHDPNDPNNILALLYSGDTLVVTDETPDYLHILYPLSDGVTITPGWVPKQYTSRGWVSAPGSVIPTYLPVNPNHLTPPVEKTLTPFGDPDTLLYSVIHPDALNVRANQPDPITGALDPSILGHLKHGDIIEITGGNAATCPIKASRINFKNASGVWVKGWITDKYTDTVGWNYKQGDLVTSYFSAYVAQMATYAAGSVTPPPPEPPTDDDLAALTARVTATETDIAALKADNQAKAEAWESFLSALQALMKELTK